MSDQDPADIDRSDNDRNAFESALHRPNRGDIANPYSWSKARRWSIIVAVSYVEFLTSVSCPLSLSILNKALVT